MITFNLFCFVIINIFTLVLNSILRVEIKVCRRSILKKICTYEILVKQNDDINVFIKSKIWKETGRNVILFSLYEVQIIDCMSNDFRNVNILANYHAPRITCWHEYGKYFSIRDPYCGLIITTTGF